MESLGGNVNGRGHFQVGFCGWWRLFGNLVFLSVFRVGTSSTRRLAIAAWRSFGQGLDQAQETLLLLLAHRQGINQLALRFDR